MKWECFSRHTRPWEFGASLRLWDQTTQSRLCVYLGPFIFMLWFGQRPQGVSW